MAEKSTLVVRRSSERTSLEDHFLNPASLESVIDDIYGEIKVISDGLTSLHSHRELTFIQVDMYRAEFLDIVKFLLWPMVQSTELFFALLAQSVELKEQEMMIQYLVHVQAKILPRCRRMMDGCAEFLVLLCRVAEIWKSRSTQVIHNLEDQQSNQTIISRLSQLASQRLWSPTPGSVQAIPALLQLLNGTLAKLATDVERVDVYWRQRADRLTRHVGPLNLTWSEAEDFHLVWRKVSGHWQHVASHIIEAACDVSFLEPKIKRILLSDELHASWLRSGEPAVT